MALEDALLQFRNSLGRDYISSGLIGLDGLHVAFDSTDPSHDEVKAAAELADGLKELTNMVQDINCGNIQHITIATDQHKLFLFPLTSNNKYFCALTIKGDGNVGKALLEMEKTKKILEKEVT